MADFNLSYTGNQVNSAIEAVTNALGSGGILSVNSFNNTIANYSTTAQMNTKIASCYPVGVVYITSTNTNPGNFLGGTWELIDKEFAPQSIDSFTPTLNTTNCSSASVSGRVTGHSIHIAITLATNVTVTDSTFAMCTIDPNKFGITTWYSARWTHFSDGQNVVIAFSMDGNGVVSTLDVLQRNNTAASLAAGSLTNMHVETITRYNYMLDSWCDKFYWKRTA